MKKYLLLIALSIAGICFNAKAELPKLSPSTKVFLTYYQTPNWGVHEHVFNVKRTKEGQVLVAGMVKVRHFGVQEALDKLGVHVGTKAGDVWTVQVPMDKVKALCQMEQLAYVQLDLPLKSHMREVRKQTRVDSVQEGINLPQAYTGKNVVVGFIDFGFDYNHPTFYDTSGQQYRVKRVWQQDGGGTPPTGYTYGHELKTESDILAGGTDNPVQNHGTAVASLATGSGFGSDTLNLKGVAFESDMVFVGVRRDSIESQWFSAGFSDFVDGINYIFTYADQESKPAVTNISWGCQTGPHDGTSLFNQACDNLSGAGKLIVMSAGNDGSDPIYLGKTFTNTDTLLQSVLNFSDNQIRRTWLDVWGEAGKTWCGQINLYDNSGAIVAQTPRICLDDSTRSYTLTTSTGTCEVTFVNASAEWNGDPRMVIVIDQNCDERVSMRLTGTDGKISVWNESYYYGYKYKYSCVFTGGLPQHTAGSISSTVSDLGSSENVLLVGAYTSEIKFIDISGATRQYSATKYRISSFSSRGPLRDGRIKPDIAAPGLTISGAISSFDTSYTPTGSNKQVTIYEYLDAKTNKNYYWGQFAGTSASAPIASGIVAMMLEANPALTPRQMIDIIKETAIKDTYTGNIPAQGNNIWGFGKINAYGAVQKVLSDLGIQAVNGQPNFDALLYPNPTKGDINIELMSMASKDIDVTIFNMLGQVVYTETLIAYNGQKVIHIPAQQWEPGMYQCVIKDAHGSRQFKVSKM